MSQSLNAGLDRLAEQPLPQPGGVDVISDLAARFACDAPLDHRTRVLLALLFQDPEAPPQGPAFRAWVCGELSARRALGTVRYGRPLETHNGRDVARDLREELLDAAAYSHQLALEADDAARAGGGR